MNLRVMQWNISWKCTLADIARFVTKTVGQDPAIVCLEEVERPSFTNLRDFLKPTDSRFSLDLHRPVKGEGRARELGVAVLTFGLLIVSEELLDLAVFPERTLSVLIGGVSDPIRVVAFHSLTGSGYGELKVSNFGLIAEYLRLHRNELDFLYFDANEPRRDSMDADKLVFWPHGEVTVKKAGLIMGSQKVHDLSDSYVDYLRSKGKVVTRDPLTVSYKTGTPKKKQVEKRYDYVMQSRRWRVTNCEYPYEESVAATADHSAVIADFEPA